MSNDIINIMKHYICTGGCMGVSDKPGVCQATDCPKHGKPLEECSCKDGKHNGRQDKKGAGPADSPSR